jgi:hypothetical protein
MTAILLIKLRHTVRSQVVLRFISFKIGTILTFTVGLKVILTIIVPMKILWEVLKAERQIQVMLRNTSTTINALKIIQFHITLLHIAFKTVSNYL